MPLLYKRTGKRGPAYFAILAAAGLACGWTATPVRGAALSAAEVVALRFPPDVSGVSAERGRVRGLHKQIVSSLAFSPYGPQRPILPDGLSAMPPAEKLVAYADPAAEGATGMRNIEQIMRAMPPSIQRPSQASAANQAAVLFNDAQIAHIKQRLKLTREQEQNWPAVESALRAVVWRQGRERGTKTATLDPTSVERLKAAAAGLIAKLRDDQKRELQLLAHLVGLKKIASEL
jgi:hypothetical protein